MLSAKSNSVPNMSQRDHGAAGDCTLKHSTHASSNDRGDHQQGKQSRLAYLPRSPERRCNDAPSGSEPVPTIKEVVNVTKELRGSRSGAIHWMPPEIIGIIFESCLDNEAPTQAAVLKPPLLLGRVCSYWRSVSQRTPRLWTSLSLKFLETMVDRSRDGVQVSAAVETWLQRSYPVPLSIAFTDNRIFQKDTEDVVVWLLSCISTHADRWKAIYLKFSSDYFIQLSVLSSCAFTSLSSFSLHIDHMGWRRGLLSLQLDLSQATRLRSLAYTGPEHVNREEILVNWKRLTSVALSYDLHESGGQSATLPRYFSTLVSCRNLAELSVGLSITPAQHLQQLNAATQGLQFIELPRLHTLRVRRLSRSAHACALMDALILPQLSTLDIDSAVLVGWDNFLIPLSHPDMQQPTQIHTHDQSWHAHHFSALLDRSACHLHTLRIRDVDMSPSELVRLLTSASTSATLSTFTFEPYPRVYPISDVLARLIPVPDSESAASSLSLSPSSSLGSVVVSIRDSLSLSLPSLIKLRLGCAHETHLERIADLIESRTGECAAQVGVQPLAVFELVFYDFVYSHGRGRQPWRKLCFDTFKERVLRCAREVGMDVDIKVERPYEPAYLSVP